MKIKSYLLAVVTAMGLQGLPAGSDTLRVAVSGTYAAKVDGEVVAFGQYTDFPQDKTYTETRLRPCDRPRTLTVETWFSGNRFSSHYDGEPGLWAEILSSNRVVGASSRTWQVAPMDAYERSSTGLRRRL